MATFPPIQPKPTVTFVLRDAGETKALLPVMEKLNSQNVDYSIVADGTARQLTVDNPHLVHSQTEINVASSRNPALAAVWQQKLNQALQSTCCVTGLVSDFQKRWAEFFSKNGRHVMGYYDAFSFTDLNQKLIGSFQGFLTDLITPSADTANYCRSNGFSSIPVLPLGQPALETADQAFHQSNTALLTKQLGLSPQLPTLLWVGQYGQDYEQAFRLFCQAVRQLPNANILVSLHPRENGSAEYRILQEFGLSQRIKTIPKTVSTEQALPLANTVLSHNSTMSMQAFLQGKNVVLAGTQPRAFNPLINYHLVPRGETPLALADEINRSLLNGNAQQTVEQRYQMLGIPTQATERISRYILTTAQS